jgi:KaiC/GvpD/RAD55 family RecA-like ATPase
MFHSGYMSENERKLYEVRSKIQQIKSKFNFVNNHNGFRKGCIHTLLGTTGGGKTTAVRSIIRDIVFTNQGEQKVLVWLSEESVSDYKTELSFGLPSHDILNSITFFSENDNQMSGEGYVLALKEYIEENKPDVLIIDNITTSSIYEDKGVREQGRMASAIKALIKKYDIACILIAHTGAEVSDNSNRLINENDIRGSKKIVNLSEFLYILQRFQIGSTYYPTLRIRKHRGQQIRDNLFFLRYDQDLRSFTQDLVIDFKTFKEKFKIRNVL